MKTTLCTLAIALSATVTNAHLRGNEAQSMRAATTFSSDKMIGNNDFFNTQLLELAAPDTTGKSGALKPDPQILDKIEADKHKQSWLRRKVRVAEQKNALKKFIKQGAPAAKIAEEKKILKAEINDEKLEHELVRFDSLKKKVSVGKAPPSEVLKEEAKIQKLEAKVKKTEKYENVEEMDKKEKIAEAKELGKAAPVAPATFLEMEADDDDDDDDDALIEEAQFADDDDDDDDALIEEAQFADDDDDDDDDFLEIGMDEDKDMEGPDLTGKSGANKPDPKNPTNAPDESDEDKKQWKDAMARVAEQKDAVKKAIKRGAPAAKIAEEKAILKAEIKDEKLEHEKVKADRMEGKATPEQIAKEQAKVSKLEAIVKKTEKNEKVEEMDKKEKIAEAKELGTASDTLAKTATKSFLEMEADDDDDDDDDALIEEAQFADDDDDDDALIEEFDDEDDDDDDK